MAMKRVDARLRALVMLILVSLGLACNLLFLAGSIRYGGPESLVQRVRAEVAARRPHPQYVPTPLAAPSDALHPAGAQPTLEPGVGLTPVPPAGASDVAITDSLAGPAAASASGAPAPIHRPAAEVAELAGLSHMWQTWNNCGPATLAMNLSYFGVGFDQAQVATVLKPNRDDKNVNPEEIADFARAQGFNALVRVNGDSDRLRTLLSNGVPVLIETWLEPEPGDGMGHYRLLTGYDDAARQWTVYDSYVSVGVDPKQPYRGIRLAYDEVERLWSVFNHTYIVIYSDELAPVVSSVLGEDADDTLMWQRALSRASAEVEARPEDPFAWFNLGSALTALGQFEEAAVAYDRARVIGLPWRMLWYQFGPFRAYYETGRYQELSVLADATLATAGNIEEVYYWKGLELEAQGDAAGARQAWQRAIELNANYAEAAAALARLDGSPPENQNPPAAQSSGGG
jgi:tetratricopeptide (TPR) repeat protein